MKARLSSQRALGIFMGALCLGLGALAARELNDAPAAAPAPPAVAAVDETAKIGVVHPFSMPPMQHFAVVTERPLFSPDRKPPRHDAAMAGAWSSFVLAGIIITPQSREALVVHGKPPTVAHVKEGQAVDGWTITSIHPDSAVLRNGAEEHELRLTPKAPPPDVVTRPRLPAE